jgi:hypothetical protein
MAMSVVYLTKATLGIFARRVNRLSGASTRQWGSMTMGDMLGHLIQTLRVSLGEIHVEDQSTPLTRSVAGYVMFQLMGLLPLMGYLYGAPNFYRISHHAQMAVRTSVAFIVLARERPTPRHSRVRSLCPGPGSIAWG